MATKLQHKLDDFDNFVLVCQNFVRAIENYSESDRLITWYEYLLWIEENFVIDFKKKTIFELILGTCLVQFEHDEKYKKDRRFIKLLIKYVYYQEEANRCYEKMLSEGFGVKVADFYINWAFHFEVNGNFARAKEIFDLGLAAQAQPLELLRKAILKSSNDNSLLQKLTLGQNKSDRREYCEYLQKRREEISALRISGQARANESKSSALHRFGYTTLMNVCIPKGALPQKHNTSVAQHLSTDLYAIGIQLGHNFKSKNLPQTQSPVKAYYDPPRVNSSEIYVQKFPGYDLIMLIPADNVAFSQEELMAYKWFKQRRIENTFTKEQDKVWGVGYDVPIRWANLFPCKNLIQSEWLVPRIMCIKPDELNEDGLHKYKCNMAELYPKDSTDEYSLEEVMWKKHKILGAKGRNMTRVKVFNDQAATGAIKKMRFAETSTRNKPVPNRTKALGDIIFKQQMEIENAKAWNRAITKKIRPKRLVFEDEEKENIFVPENLQHLYNPGAQSKAELEFWENARAITSIESNMNIAEKSSGMNSSLKLTTSVTEDIADIHEMIINVLNAAECNGNNCNGGLIQSNYGNAVKRTVDCSTPIMKPAHNYSFSYELLETTAEFERLEALCAISPDKEPLTSHQA